ncbi:hypothetical protein DFH07DRAFT_953103 [Mycena maculata]|uniref:RNase III domain-containing protein n=1 Tax=Mycena maculata TaxID=230809 RepID=A0AAD7JVJ0_9AGAR|nr:hypothetical protein DFH07DRAFT_953103 [Mycena maculata]
MHIYYPTHPLRPIIPDRYRVPLASPPDTSLLQQVDDLWPPMTVKHASFPPEYPPALPVLDDSNEKSQHLYVELMCSAFATGENAALEWLGDAVIGATVAARMYQHNMPISDIFNALINRRIGASLWPTALVERMSDVFESVAGVAESHFGLELTLAWLQRLFDPSPNCVRRDIQQGYARSRDWCGRNTRLACGGFGAKRPHLCESSLCRLKIWHLSALVCGLHRKREAQTLLAITGPGWHDLDASRVSFPVGYPPSPPPLKDADTRALTGALTDILCNVHFGAHVGVSNEGYQHIVRRFCYLAVTKLALDQLPTATPAELDDVRSVCVQPGFLSRLGLVFNLDRHLRVLRRAGDDSSVITAQESAYAFCALMGVIYLRVGWTKLFAWLNRLFSPWIVAAGKGPFPVMRHFHAKQHAQDLKEQAVPTLSAGRLRAARSKPTRRRVQGTVAFIASPT